MKVKLGDLSDNLNALREMREQLIEEDSHSIEEAAECERWLSFNSASERISEAVEDRNLESLVAAVREMKNRLRRPAIRKALLRMEMAGKEKEAPEGDCHCEKCNGTIDGSSNPCVPGALCTKCALKKDSNDKKRQKDEPEAKGKHGDDSKADTGKSIKDREAESNTKNDRKGNLKSLRSRGYEGEQ
jgi:hypothetical protein